MIDRSQARRPVGHTNCAAHVSVSATGWLLSRLRATPLFSTQSYPTNSNCNENILLHSCVITTRVCAMKRVLDCENRRQTVASETYLILFSGLQRKKSCELIRPRLKEQYWQCPGSPVLKTRFRGPLTFKTCYYWFY